MEEKIKEAIRLLNENGYIVSKVSEAQTAIAKNCSQNKSRCNFNAIGIKCVDLLCIQDLIREQILPNAKEEENRE